MRPQSLEKVDYYWNVMKIDPTSNVSKSAAIGKNVEIGPYTIVHDNVEIGDNSKIGAFCEIGLPTANAQSPELFIGAESNIRSHSVFYAGSSFGHNLVTGHRVTVRENIEAGTDFQIGTLCDLQGSSKFGNYVKLHSSVHIGQKSTIEDFVWMFPYVVLTNDPHPPSNHLLGVTVSRFAVIATMTTVLPGLNIGEGSLVGAHSLVTKNVNANTVVAGSPAKYRGETKDILLDDKSGQAAYPWRFHFHRGYPTSLIDEWVIESQQ
jgi:acetyltransferase-like isoleucine patch superfamily enzyme